MKVIQRLLDVVVVIDTNFSTMTMLFAFLAFHFLARFSLSQESAAISV